MANRQNLYAIKPVVPLHLISAALLPNLWHRALGPHQPIIRYMQTEDDGRDPDTVLLLKAQAECFSPTMPTVAARATLDVGTLAGAQVFGQGAIDNSMKQTGRC